VDDSIVHLARQAAAQRDTTSDGPDVRPAPQVPGYEVLEEVGRGGMGVVYRARHVALDRIVALKVIRSGDLAGAEERRRFQAEAEAVARLAHSGIVQIHEVGEAAGMPFLSLEWCAGGSLAERLQGSPLAAADAAALLRSLAEAVAHAHSRDVVHRDVKP